MIEIVFWILLGVLLGTITGMIPGIHPNTIAFLVLGFAVHGDLNFALMIVSMAVTHSFVGVIPSLYFGIPDADNYAVVLPGHKLVMQGLGNYALKLTVLGSVLGGLMALSVGIVFVKFLERFQELIIAITGFAIVYVLVSMLFEGKNRGEILKIFSVIFLSALLGLIVLKQGALNEPLFPLVTGFFGASGIVYSLKGKQISVEQKIESNNYKLKDSLVGGLLSLFGGTIVAMLPSLGPSEAAFMLRKIFGNFNRIRYMIIIGGINTANMILSFFALYSIGKARTGAAVAIREIISVEFKEIILIVSTIVVAIGISAILTELISIRFARIFDKIDFKKLGVLVLLFLIGIVFGFEGLLGVAVLITASAIGVFTQSMRVRKSVCMAFLMVPTALFYFGLG